MKKGSFEAKKHAYRQTQDGVVISFVVHPDDISPELATAPLGTQYMIGYARISDDGKPEQLALPDETEKKRRQFDSLHPSAQAAILANDPEFQLFINETNTSQLFVGDCQNYAEIATKLTRERLGVKSRSELNTDPKAKNRWDVLRSQFKQWQTDKRYAESRTH